MASEEQRAFLEKNRLVIVGLGRKSGPPHLSPVYYVIDADERSSDKRTRGHRSIGLTPRSAV